MSLLSIRDLVFRPAGASCAAILDHLDLAIEQGEVHALLGANGTGKSTLAYVIMGCEGYRPSEGELLYDGAALAGLKIHERARKGITMAWQEPVRFEGVTVADYLSLGTERGAADSALELVGMNPALYRDRMVDRSLSGGERKRIELASLLALKPRLAIMDEPDSGIDMLSTRDIINVISAFKERGSAVLLITHREEIALIADRASQLCNGRIICSGTPEGVAGHYKKRHCGLCDGTECHYV
ncbi:MAG: ABC transporter ATP-binding protein [Nitrospirota bacterium]|nr:ABC transporter ATP-binding protein [Nitrospirota bacterium]